MLVLITAPSSQQRPFSLSVPPSLSLSYLLSLPGSFPPSPSPSLSLTVLLSFPFYMSLPLSFSSSLSPSFSKILNWHHMHKYWQINIYIHRNISLPLSLSFSPSISLPLSHSLFPPLSLSLPPHSVAPSLTLPLYLSLYPLSLSLPTSLSPPLSSPSIPLSPLLSLLPLSLSPPLSLPLSHSVAPSLSQRCDCTLQPGVRGDGLWDPETPGRPPCLCRED